MRDGIPDVIIDNVYGYLSADLEVDEYCKAIKRYLDNPLFCQCLIGYFTANYSLMMCVEEYENIYSKNKL